MKKMRGIICALLLMMLTAVTVHADEGVSQKPDYFTDYYMIVESAAGGIDIYSEADYESSKLNDTLIPNGTAIRIEGERTGKDNKDWGYTRYHGMYGYVPFDDLKPVTASEAIESEYTAFGGTDVDFDVTVKTENGGTALYGGPGEKFGEVSAAGRIADGTTVHISQYVHGEDGKDWGKTSTQSGEGWIDLGDTDYVPSVDIVEDENAAAAASAEAQATPTATPTPAPTATPTVTPTPEPTATEPPTSTPTAEPTATEEPTAAPTDEPTSTPTEEVTPTEETPPTEAASETEDEKAEDASAQNVSAESSWMKNPVIWIVLVIIILIVAVVIYFKKKK